MGEQAHRQLAEGLQLGLHGARLGGQHHAAAAHGRTQAPEAPTGQPCRSGGGKGHRQARPLIVAKSLHEEQQIAAMSVEQRTATEP